MYKPPEPWKSQITRESLGYPIGLRPLDSLISLLSLRETMSSVIFVCSTTKLVHVQEKSGTGKPITEQTTMP